MLLTGATGFLGKEVLAQVADDPRVTEVVAVVRPETIRDPKTKEVVAILSPKERGRLLLKRLHLDDKRARKFRFVDGDIEKPDLGMPEGKAEKLRQSLTHVVHCAASVSFDDTYANSYRANVLGNRRALLFSLSCQNTPGSPFVAHVAIETELHPRAQEAVDRPGERARLPAALLQQLLRAHEGDGLDRDGSRHDRAGAAGDPAPALHRDRRTRAPGTTAATPRS